MLSGTLVLLGFLYLLLLDNLILYTSCNTLEMSCSELFEGTSNIYGYMCIYIYYKHLLSKCISTYVGIVRTTQMIR